MQRARITRMIAGMSLVLSAGLLAGPTTLPDRSFVYPGWVHVQSRRLPSTQPAEDEGLEVLDNVSQEDSFYINKKQGAQCLFHESAGEKTIRLVLPQQGRIMEYSGKHKAVAIGTLHPDERRRIADAVAGQPLTVGDIVALVRESEADIVSTREESDGPFRRLEIVFVGGSMCDKSEAVGGRNTVWFDPKTGLIHKLQADFGQGPLEMTYTYLKRDIKDVFDVGAPRGVPVIDSRPDPQTGALLDRLDRRFERDYGDYVAIVTQTNHGKPFGQGKKMFLYLYARQGSSAFYGEYSLRADGYPEAPILKLSGWPKPTLKQVLDLAAGTAPVFFYATDNTTAWAGTFDPSAIKTAKIREHRQPLKKMPYKVNYRLADSIWKGRDALRLWGFGPRPQVIADKARPNLLGLRIQDVDFSPSTRPAPRTERLFWIDPSRDDMPVETIMSDERSVSPTRTVTVDFRVRYSEFTQLPNGRWYPARWDNQLGRKETGKPVEGFSLEYHLQIFPGAKLDPGWYASRVDALKKGRSSP